MRSTLQRGKHREVDPVLKVVHDLLPLLVHWANTFTVEDEASPEQNRFSFSSQSSLFFSSSSKSFFFLLSFICLSRNFTAFLLTWLRAGICEWWRWPCQHVQRERRRHRLPPAHWYEPCLQACTRWCQCTTEKERREQGFVWREILGTLSATVQNQDSNRDFKKSQHF